MRGLRCICMQLCESVLGCVLRECLHLRGLERNRSLVGWSRFCGIHRRALASTACQKLRPKPSQQEARCHGALRRLPLPLNSPDLSKNTQSLHKDLLGIALPHAVSTLEALMHACWSRVCSARACTLLTIKSVSMLSRQPGSSLHEQVNEVPAHASEDRLAVATLCRYCNLWRHKDFAGQKTARKTHLLCGRLSQPMPRPCILGILEARLHTA